MNKVSYKEKYADLWPTNYKVGMWFWLLHRVTGLYIIIYGVIHLWESSLSVLGPGGAAFDWFYSKVGLHPLIQVLDIITILALLYHGMNGLRILLFDLGIGIRSHKIVFAVVMFIGFVIWIFAINETMHYITGSTLW